MRVWLKNTIITTLIGVFFTIMGWMILNEISIMSGIASLERQQENNLKENDAQWKSLKNVEEQQYERDVELEVIIRIQKEIIIPMLRDKMNDNFDADTFIDELKEMFKKENQRTKTIEEYRQYQMQEQLIIK